MITATNEDNMDLMARYPDKYFDLAIVDPPYGLKNRSHTYHKPGQSQKNSLSKFKPVKWDNDIPTRSYFEELFRVSKNQIIWGGNYFGLPPSRCIICWDKMVYLPTMSQIEFAWTSFNKLPKLIKINNSNKNRIHVTEKPVKLYEWILDNYAKPGYKILDTHGGSMNIGVACENKQLDLTICEIDKTYFESGLKNIKDKTEKLKLST